MDEAADPKKVMEKRDAILLFVAFVAVTVAKHFDIPIPQEINDFLETGDSTLTALVALGGLFGLRTVARNKPKVDKALHVGQVLPESAVKTERVVTDEQAVRSILEAARGDLANISLRFENIEQVLD